MVGINNYVVYKYYEHTLGYRYYYSFHTGIKLNTGISCNNKNLNSISKTSL